MNNKQKKTLKDIFTKPTLAGLRWKDVESLLVNIGCKVVEGNGSRVRFIYKNSRLTIHRPHPSPNATKISINEVRKFFIEIGVKNDF